MTPPSPATLAGPPRPTQPVETAPLVDGVPPPAQAAPPGARGIRSTPGVRGGALILIGILLVAVNLRIAITSLGPLLDEVRTGLQLSGAVAGLVTTMPAVAFAAVGALTPWLVRRFSPARVLVVAMAALAVGQALRVTAAGPIVFLATSALALAGIAVANILLPMLVKQYFPHRTGLVTGAYMMALTVGSTVGAAAAVPIAYAFGSWRAGLGVWAVIAAFAVLPWLPSALRRSRRPAIPVAVIPVAVIPAAVIPAAVGAAAVIPAAVGAVAVTPAAADAVRVRVRPGRSRLGWAMAIYFGLQSLGAYALMGWLAQLFRDAGYSPQSAGLLLAMVTALGVPIAVVMPAVAVRRGTLRPLVLMLSAAMILAYAGLVLAPRAGALLWIGLLAFGQGAFPLILTVIGLRARTTEGTVALSAFAQSAGYLIAALGPLLIGLCYELTGGWTAPIGLLMVGVVIQTLAGLAIARPRFIEDDPRAMAAG